MRILVIEDDSALCKSIEDMLNGHSYQTDIAENLKDGEYFISIRNYDLVLSDWDLPDGCGVDIISQVKEKSPRTPVVIMSSKSSVENELHAFKE